MSMPEFYPRGGQPPAEGAEPPPATNGYARPYASQYQPEPQPSDYPAEQYQQPYPDGSYPQQYPSESYPQQSQPPESYPREPYQRESYDSGGYPAQPYPDGSYPPQQSYPAPTYQPEAQATETYEATSYRAAEPYQAGSYPEQQPYPPGAHAAAPYPPESYQPEGYQQDGYPPEGYPDEGNLPVLTEERPKSRRQGARTSPSLLLAVLGVVVLVAGLLFPENGDSGFGRLPLWSVFAAGCAVAVLVGVLRPAADGARIATIAGAGLAGYWLLLVLPGVASQTGFLLTAGCALGCGAAWLRRSGPAPAA